MHERQDQAGDCALPRGCGTWAAVVVGNAGGYSVGHILFHQAPPHECPPLPTCPVSDLSTPKSYAGACVDEYSVIWRQTMDKECRGLVSAGALGEI